MKTTLQIKKFGGTNEIIDKKMKHKVTEGHRSVFSFAPLSPNIEEINFSQARRQLESSLINGTTHSFSLSLLISQSVQDKLTITACGQICVTSPEGSA